MPVVKLDWEDIDWSLSDSDIAEQKGVEYHRAHQKRKELQKPMPTQFKRSIREKWGNVNWSKSDSTIANETQSNVASVRYWRRRMKEGYNPNFRTYDASLGYHYKIKDFDVIDWNLQDVVLAVNHGVSRERIRQLRKVLGKPRAQNYRMPSHESEVNAVNQNLIDTIKRRKVFMQKTGVVRIAKSLNITTDLAKRLLVKADIKCADDRKKWDLSRLNFELPNCILESVWGVSQMVVSAHRKKFNKPDAKWQTFNGMIKSHDLKEIGEFNLAVRAEKEIAEKYKAKINRNNC